MDKEMKREFWKDFVIPTQEEVEEVAFANPSDVARSLVKGRNWYATASASLAEAMKKRDDQLAILQDLENKRDTAESLIVANYMNRNPDFKLPTSTVKNKQTMQMFVFSKASPAERDLLDEIEEHRRDAVSEKMYWVRECGELESMRRAIEKTTEWLIQYINWYKFELRERV